MEYAASTTMNGQVAIGAGTTEFSGGAVELEFERIGLPSISTGSDEGACAGIIGFPSMSVWNPLKS